MKSHNKIRYEIKSHICKWKMASEIHVVHLIPPYGPSSRVNVKRLNYSGFAWYGTRYNVLTQYGNTQYSVQIW